MGLRRARCHRLAQPSIPQSRLGRLALPTPIQDISKLSAGVKLSCPTNEGARSSSSGSPWYIFAVVWVIISLMSSHRQSKSLISAKHNSLGFFSGHWNYPRKSKWQSPSPAAVWIYLPSQTGQGGSFELLDANCRSFGLREIYNHQRITKLSYEFIQYLRTYERGNTLGWDSFHGAHGLISSKPLV